DPRGPRRAARRRERRGDPGRPPRRIAAPRARAEGGLSRAPPPVALRCGDGGAQPAVAGRTGRWGRFRLRSDGPGLTSGSLSEYSELLVQGPAGQARENVDVAPAGPLDDLVGEAGRRRVLVPAEGLEVVADVLLVEGRLGAPLAVGLLRPEAGGVRRHDLIGQHQAVPVAPELELRVGDDDAAR